MEGGGGVQVWGRCWSGVGVDGAGLELNGAGSILGIEPAPSEQRRRPIRGAGSAPVLEPAPSAPGTCTACL